MNSIKKDINKLYELSIRSINNHDLIIWKKEDINEWVNGIFTIYVTGIADWCDGTNPSKLMIVWNRAYRNHILSLIPARFKQINIIHYDILEYINNGKLEIRPLKDRVLISDFINDYIINEDNKIPKVTSVFRNDYIPLDRLENKIHSYILLDLAHAFEYTDKIGYMKLNEKEYKITRIYERYHGNDLELTRYPTYFYVNSDNTIVSYYDKLLEVGLSAIPVFDINTIKFDEHIIKSLKGYKMYDDKNVDITQNSVNTMITKIYLDKLGTSLDDIDSIIWHAIYNNNVILTMEEIQIDLKRRVELIKTEIKTEINEALEKLKK
jgi:hypothetical protein